MGIAKSDELWIASKKINSELDLFVSYYPKSFDHLSKETILSAAKQIPLNILKANSRKTSTEHKKYIKNAAIASHALSGILKHSFDKNGITDAFYELIMEQLSTIQTLLVPELEDTSKFSSLRKSRPND